MLPLLCSVSLFSPKFAVKSIIFSQFWPRGLLPKLLDFFFESPVLVCWPDFRAGLRFLLAAFKTLIHYPGSMKNIPKSLERAYLNF